MHRRSAELGQRHRTAQAEGGSIVQLVTVKEGTRKTQAGAGKEAGPTGHATVPGEKQEAGKHAHTPCTSNANECGRKG